MTIFHHEPSLTNQKITEIKEILVKLIQKITEDHLKLKLRYLRQIGTLAAYIDEFYELFNQITISESEAIDCFLEGLAPAIRDPIRILRLRELKYVIALAIWRSPASTSEDSKSKSNSDPMMIDDRSLTNTVEEIIFDSDRGLDRRVDAEIDKESSDPGDRTDAVSSNRSSVTTIDEHQEVVNILDRGSGPVDFEGTAGSNSFIHNFDRSCVGSESGDAIVDIDDRKNQSRVDVAVIKTVPDLVKCEDDGSVIVVTRDSDQRSVDDFANKFPDVGDCTHAVKNEADRGTRLLKIFHSSCQTKLRSQETKSDHGAAATKLRSGISGMNSMQQNVFPDEVTDYSIANSDQFTGKRFDYGCELFDEYGINLDNVRTAANFKLNSVTTFDKNPDSIVVFDRRNAAVLVSKKGSEDAATLYIDSDTTVMKNTDQIGDNAARSNVELDAALKFFWREPRVLTNSEFFCKGADQNSATNFRFDRTRVPLIVTKFSSGMNSVIAELVKRMTAIGNSFSLLSFNKVIHAAHLFDKMPLKPEFVSREPESNIRILLSLSEAWRVLSVVHPRILIYNDIFVDDPSLFRLLIMDQHHDTSTALIHERYVMRLRKKLEYVEKKHFFRRRVLSKSESVRWLNHAVEKIWPTCIERIASQHILLPIIPWFLEKYKPWTAKKAVVQHLYLGRNAPLFTEMRVLREMHQFKY